MKKIITFVLLIFSLTVNAQLPPDKKDHLLAGTLIGSSATIITINNKPINSLCWSLGSAAVIGGSKELIYDKWMGKGTPELKDFGWTIVGSVTGFAIIQGFKLACKQIDKRHYRRSLQY